MSELIQSKAEIELLDLLEASSKVKDPDSAWEILQKAADHSPNDTQVQEKLQKILFKRLRRDAFLAFLAETEVHYIISFRNSRPVVIPKSRVHPEMHRDPQQAEGERVQGMLWWLAAGLIPVGLGALVLSPVVAARAIEIFLHRKSTKQDKRLAWVALIMTGLLGGLGMVFSLLFVMHLFS